MVHIIKESSGPFPDDWKPGMPLPDDIVSLHVDREYFGFHQRTFKDTTMMMLNASKHDRKKKYGSTD